MTLRDRIAELRVVIAERDSQGVPWVSITCIACGRTDMIGGPNLDRFVELFADWQLGDERPYRDYCPDCRD